MSTTVMTPAAGKRFTCRVAGLIVVMMMTVGARSAKLSNSNRRQSRLTQIAGVGVVCTASQQCV